MSFVCSYRWCDRTVLNEVPVGILTVACGLGLVLSWRRYNAASSRITSQAFVKVYRCTRITLPRGRQLFDVHCPTCLHPSAPVAPPAICSDRPGLSLVCHARLVYTVWRRANIVQTGDPDVPDPLLAQLLYSFYWLLLFIVPMTFITVDADVLLPPTLWLFVRQWIVTVGNRAFPVAVAKVLNKLPSDVAG